MIKVDKSVDLFETNKTHNIYSIYLHTHIRSKFKMDQSQEPLRFYFTPFNSFIRTGKNEPILDTHSLQKSCSNLFTPFFTQQEMAYYKKVSSRTFPSSNWIKKYQEIVNLYLSSDFIEIGNGPNYSNKLGTFIKTLNKTTKEKFYFCAEEFWASDIIQLLTATNNLKTTKSVYVSFPTHFGEIKRAQIMNAFEICGIERDRVHLINAGLCCGPSVLSFDNSLVVKMNQHQRLMILVDDNGIEFHLINYDKENYAIRTLASSGSFGLCIQEFAFDCAKKVLGHIPWGSFIPTFRAVYEELLQVFSTNEKLQFPLKLICTDNFQLEENLIADVVESYKIFIQKKLCQLYVDTERLNDIVVCGTNFLTSLIKSVLSQQEFISIPVISIEEKQIPMMLLSGMPCSIGNIKLVPSVYKTICYKTNNNLTLMPIDLKVGLENKVNVKIDSQGPNYVKFHRGKREIFSTDSFGNLSFSVGIDSNGMAMIKQNFSSTNVYECCTLSPSQKELIAKYLDNLYSKVYHTSHNLVIQLKITLDDQFKSIDPNNLDEGIPSTLITIIHTNGSIRLSNLNYYSRTPKIVHLYESKTSVEPIVSFWLESSINFFNNYIVPNCIQLEKFNFQQTNQIILGNEEIPTIINTNNAQIFCRVNGHEFQINI